MNETFNYDRIAFVTGGSGFVGGDLSAPLLLKAGRSAPSPEAEVQLRR
jgi:hypothetical protein